MTRLLFFLLLITSSTFGQTTAQHKAMYRKAFEEQKAMIEGKTSKDFKKSVFLVENTFYKNTLNYSDFCGQITSIGKTMKSMIISRGNQKFKTAANWAAFNFLTDTIPENNNKPYIYDFEDFYGKKDFSRQFVTKLLRTKTGNCHSMPFLYKMICEEIGGKASLALAPNHCYIKHINEQGQWMSVEMTSATFPKDHVIMKSLGVTSESVRSGAYMRAMTSKEEIVFTMFDLIGCYCHQYGYDSFCVEIANYALKHYPNCIELYMIKINTLGPIIEKAIKKQKETNIDNRTFINGEIAKYKAIEKKMFALGYQDMPKELYESWLKRVEKVKNQRSLPKK